MYSTSLPKHVTFKKYALLAESLTIITTPVFLTTSDPSLPQLVIVKKSNSIYWLEISHLFSCSHLQELIHLYISARVALTIAHWSPSKVWSADNSSEDWSIEVGGGGWGFWRLNDNFRSDILPCVVNSANVKITVTQHLWCFLLILCDTVYCNEICWEWKILIKKRKPPSCFTRVMQTFRMYLFSISYVLQIFLNIGKVYRWIRYLLTGSVSWSLTRLVDKGGGAPLSWHFRWLGGGGRWRREIWVERLVDYGILQSTEYWFLEYLRNRYLLLVD